jgi:hypothetical protein
MRDANPGLFYLLHTSLSQIQDQYWQTENKRGMPMPRECRSVFGKVPFGHDAPLRGVLCQVPARRYERRVGALRLAGWPRLPKPSPLPLGQGFLFRHCM